MEDKERKEYMSLFDVLDLDTGKAVILILYFRDGFWVLLGFDD